MNAITTNHGAPAGARDLDRLLAVHAHATAHGLGDTIRTLGVSSTIPIAIYVASDYSRDNVPGRRRFVRWMRSIGAATATYPQGSGYLIANGHLDDGSPVTVRLDHSEPATVVVRECDIGDLDPDDPAGVAGAARGTEGAV